jgi:hypothetical protein
MTGLREFVMHFETEEQCIEHLAGLRWPSGSACAGCGGRQAWPRRPDKLRSQHR